ncbi:MAG: hypothetical protein ACLKAK_06375 [Alkaliphilus sp.]
MKNKQNKKAQITMIAVIVLIFVFIFILLIISIKESSSFEIMLINNRIVQKSTCVITT